MIPELDPIRSDASPWLALSQLVERAIQDMPPDSWRPTLEYDSPEQQSNSTYIKSCLMDHWQAHASHVFGAVMSRYATNQWPALEPPTTYYLRQMHGRLLCFLQGIVLRPHKNPDTIFQYPKLPAVRAEATANANPKDVLLWFQTSWWVEHGSLEMIDELGRRHDPPPFSFSNS